jgi:anti-anti-sigma factor
MTTDSLSMTESRNGEFCLLSLSGRIDSSNAGTLTARLAELIASGAKTIVIDLVSVMYLTSAAFRALLVANRDLAAKSGQLALCGLIGQVRDLFEMGGLLNVFTVFPSREEALSKLG